MKLKNINTKCAMILMDLFQVHIIAGAIGCLLKKTSMVLLIVIALLFSLICVVHTILSIIILCKKETRSIKYVKLNFETFIQRLTGILTIVLLLAHVITSVSLMNADSFEILTKIIMFIISVLYYFISLVHIAISVPKAKISLGVASDESKLQKMKKIEYIKETILFVFATVCLFIRLFA